MKHSIYLDHAATTPLHTEVIDAMLPFYQEVFGNPSSTHAYGRESRRYLNQARSSIAKLLSVKEKEIIFTSGGTEADNLAVIGVAMANKSKGNHIITTSQEHHAVLHAASFLETEGFHVTYLPVDEDGLISLTDLEAALTSETILVSVMYVNNETGAIQPIEEIGNILQDHQAYFHTDAVQAFGILQMDINALGIDLFTVSGHKISGPKGVGLLYKSDNVPMKPLQFGGNQERENRAGTENLPGIIGLEKAIQIAQKTVEDRMKEYAMFKDVFLKTLDDNNVSYHINGHLDKTVSSILNISFPKQHIESLLTNFDLEGVAASSGSACTAGSIEPSHVLKAMFGDRSDKITNSIRFSFGKMNTKENVKEAATKVAKVLNRLNDR